MNQALRQPCEEAGVVDGRFPIRFLMRAMRTMNENDVEIRSVAELEPTQFAVGDDRESGLFEVRRLSAHRPAVLRDELAPRHVERELQNELSRIGQTVTHLHERQLAETICDRDSEDGGALKLTNGLERRLDVGRINMLQIPAKRFLELVSRRRRIEYS